MKKLFAILLLASTYGFSADTFTTNSGLRKPELSANDVWGYKTNANYDIIDSSFALLSGTQTFTGGVTITSGTVSTLRVPTQILIATPTYASASDQLAVNNTLRVGGGGGGVVYACDANFQNCSSLSGLGTLNLDPGSVGGSVNLTADGSVTGALALRGSGGVFANTTSNSPVQFGARRIIAGTSYFTLGTLSVSPDSADASAFEGAVYIGTHNVVSTKLGVVGDTSYSYSMLISTSAAMSTTDYQVGISTNGALGLFPRTAANIKATIPNRVGQYFYCTDCATVSTCVSTGTAVNQWSLITSKTSACN